MDAALQRKTARKAVALILIFFVLLVAIGLGSRAIWPGAGGWVAMMLLQAPLGLFMAQAMIARGIAYRRIDGLLVLIPYVGAYMLVRWIWRGVHAAAGIRYWHTQPNRHGVTPSAG